MTNHNELISRTLANMGIETLNAMQEATLVANTKTKDILLLSPTGSGKTLAYLLPLFLKLNPSITQVQALILVPTRELAQQIENVWRSMSTGYKVSCCFGGRPSNAEKRDLLHPPALLIGTPGRLQDHIERENFDTQLVSVLILDEFDKSLEMGFNEQMESIVSHLPQVKQRILTSATNALSIPAYVGIKNPTKLDFSEQKETISQLKNLIVKAKDNDKFDLVYQLICSLGSQQCLIFCNQRDTVEKLNAYLTKRSVPNDFFHGKLEQTERERALSKFRNGSCMAFISTDLASRGLDIPEIKNVIHFDIPPREEEYIHRNGRTARMGAEGYTYLLLSAQEEPPTFVDKNTVYHVLPSKTPAPPKQQWLTIYIGKGKKDKLSKMDVAGFLYKKAEANKDDIGMIEVKEYYTFVAIKSEKANAVLERIKNEKIKNMKARFEIAE